MDFLFPPLISLHFLAFPLCSPVFPAKKTLFFQRFAKRTSKNPQGAETLVCFGRCKAQVDACGDLPFSEMSGPFEGASRRTGFSGKRRLLYLCLRALCTFLLRDVKAKLQVSPAIAEKFTSNSSSGNHQHLRLLYLLRHHCRCFITYILKLKNDNSPP